MPQFVKDVEDVRRRAIRKLEDGAVTEAYGLDKEHTISILNEALATEIVCVLRYMHHYFMATGVHGKGVAEEFKEHADAEREHADEIAERIQQLGGKPDFNPRSLVERSASQYIEGETLADMIREDLIAERIVIEVYTEMIRYFGDKDPTTRTLIEHILAEEEEHASELSDLLYIVDPRTGEDRGQDPGTDPMNIDTKKQTKSEGDGGQSRQKQGDKEEQRGELTGRGNKSQENSASRNDELQPAHIPGTTGRLKRKRSNEIEDTAAGNVDENAAAGTNRAVRLTNGNRKRKKVA